MLAVVMVAGLLSGCSFQGTTAPSNFYMLSALATGTTVSGLENVAVGVGPIGVVDYLDRPQIVTRTDGAEVTVDQYHRWAAPLREAIVHVMVTEIAARTGSASVFAYPWPPAAQVDFKVLASVGRFDTDERGLARLEVQWWIAEADTPVDVSRGVYETQVRDSGFDARITALNEVLSQFAGDVVNAIAARVD